MVFSGMAVIKHPNKLTFWQLYPHCARSQNFGDRLLRIPMRTSLLKGSSSYVISTMRQLPLSRLRFVCTQSCILLFKFNASAGQEFEKRYRVSSFRGADHATAKAHLLNWATLKDVDAQAYGQTKTM